MTDRLPPLSRPVPPDGDPPVRPQRPSGTAPVAALRIACSREGFARVRAFTLDTLHCWSLDHRSDDAILVITELAANAVAHGVPQAPPGDPEVWLRLTLDPVHLLLAVSDPGDNPPEYTPGDRLALRSTAAVCASSTPWPRNGAGPRTPRPARPCGPGCRPSLLPDMSASERPHAMRTAPTHQPSTERTDHTVPLKGVATTTPLAALDRVPWCEIQDSTGCAAAIPLLLSSVACGDSDTARAALGDLRKRICQYGFVVEQATAATVPFLWELAQLPQVTCRAEVIQLLKSIADARQWESTAAVYPKLLNRRENPVVWERAARQAVHDRRGALRRLMDEDDSDIAQATTELARSLGE